MAFPRLSDWPALCSSHLWSLLSLAPCFGRLGFNHPRMLVRSRNVSLHVKFAMGDYSSAILALIAVTAVLTTGVVYVLAQPTDVPVAKREGWFDVDFPLPNCFHSSVCLPSGSGIPNDDPRLQLEWISFNIKTSGPYRLAHDASWNSRPKRRYHVWGFTCCEIPRDRWVGSCAGLNF